MNDLLGALKAGQKISDMFGLKGIERTSSINNFAFQITGINTMEMLGFSCEVEKQIDFKELLPANND